MAEFLEQANVLEGVEYILPEHEKESQVIVDVITNTGLHWIKEIQWI